ncbi:MAG TPA: FGGY-family carbohydrate kinase [Clostridia bacterium]|nr:FGGY-family carbohydrate kinase [Clostridia bacterium]
MNKKYLLGVDVGTYESKGVLCDADGKILNMQTSPHLIKIPKPGWAEHDPMGDWWADFCSITKRLLENTGINPRDIAAIGCSAISTALVPVDENCNPLRNAILYGIDTRSVPQIKELNSTIGEERIKEICGNPLTVDFTGPKILWIKQNEPEIYEKAAHFTMTQGFLVARLTGEYILDKYSASGAGPMYNCKTGTWDDSLTSYITEKERLPRIVDSTEIVGYVTGRAAKETGLAEGTPVVGGSTDASAEAVSVGVVEPGDFMIMYGSTVYMIKVMNEPPQNTNMRSATYVFPEFSSVVGGMATTGSLTRWVRDNFAKELVEREQLGGPNAYDTLFAEIDNIGPGADGVIVLPYFSGERLPINDPSAKGVIFGLNLTHTRSHIFKAVLEGVGYGIDQCLELIRSSESPINRITAVGGGTKSLGWMQIISDITGCIQSIPEITVGAAYGDAIFAGLGVGLIKSRQEVKGWIREKYVTIPDVQKMEIYRGYKEKYAQIYNCTKEIMHSY